MGIVGAFDVHRRQLTFEYLDVDTGELRSGRVVPADREHLVGHAEVPGADHTDPGPYWDWDRYIGLVVTELGRLSAQPSPVSATSRREVPGGRCGHSRRQSETHSASRFAK